MWHILKCLCALSCRKLGQDRCHRKKKSQKMWKINGFFVALIFLNTVKSKYGHFFTQNRQKVLQIWNFDRKVRVFLWRTSVFHAKSLCWPKILSRFPRQKLVYYFLQIARRSATPWWNYGSGMMAKIESGFYTHNTSRAVGESSSCIRNFYFCMVFKWYKNI